MMKGIFKTSISLACFIGFLPASLLAQDKSTYYTVMHPDEFTIDWTGFYKKIDRLTADIRKDHPHHLDLSFGSHPKQRLDLYLPKSKSDRAPVFLFLHGGGFKEGDRTHYGFIATGFAENGFITAVASYRLTSQGYHYPDQAEDTQRALAWLYRNISKYGGDPDQIFVGGHSAGALLTAEVAVKTDWLALMGLPLDLIKGAIPVSGRYGERPPEDGYVQDDALRVIASPIDNITNTRPRFLVAVGSPEGYLEPSRQFAKKLQALGAKADFLVLEGEDHAQTALSLGSPESVLFKAALELIRGK